jgi:hypothetical protein
MHDGNHDDLEVNPYRSGFCRAYATQLAELQQQLNRAANATSAVDEQMARAVLRVAAHYTGMADEILHYLADLNDPAQPDANRDISLAKLRARTEVHHVVPVQDPTERGAAAGHDVIGWLDQILPPWPDDMKVIMSGNGFISPRTAGTARDYECYPQPESIHIPLGALISAIKAVAEQGGVGAETLRRALAEHEVPQTAAFITLKNEYDRRSAEDVAARRRNRP